MNRLHLLLVVLSILIVLVVFQPLIAKLLNQSTMIENFQSAPVLSSRDYDRDYLIEFHRCVANPMSADCECIALSGSRVGKTNTDGTIDEPQFLNGDYDLCHITHVQSNPPDTTTGIKSIAPLITSDSSEDNRQLAISYAKQFCNQYPIFVGFQYNCPTAKCSSGDPGSRPPERTPGLYAIYRGLEKAGLGDDGNADIQLCPPIGGGSQNSDDSADSHVYLKKIRPLNSLNPIDPGIPLYLTQWKQLERGETTGALASGDTDDLQQQQQSQQKMTSWIRTDNSLQYSGIADLDQLRKYLSWREGKLFPDGAQIKLDRSPEELNVTELRDRVIFQLIKQHSGAKGYLTSNQYNDGTIDEDQITFSMGCDREGNITSKAEAANSEAGPVSCDSFTVPGALISSSPSSNSASSGQPWLDNQTELCQQAAQSNPLRYLPTDTIKEGACGDGKNIGDSCTMCGDPSNTNNQFVNDSCQEGNEGATHPQVVGVCVGNTTTGTSSDSDTLSCQIEQPPTLLSDDALKCQYSKEQSQLTNYLKSLSIGQLAELTRNYTQMSQEGNYLGMMGDGAPKPGVCQSITITGQSGSKSLPSTDCYQPNGNTAVDADGYQWERVHLVGSKEETCDPYPAPCGGSYWSKRGFMSS